MNNLYKNSIARFKKTGNLYKVLSSDCKMKHPETREWIEAVIYQGYKVLVGDEYQDDLEKKVWVRELKEFNERFEIV